MKLMFARCESADNCAFNPIEKRMQIKIVIVDFFIIVLVEFLKCKGNNNHL